MNATTLAAATILAAHDAACVVADRTVAPLTEAINNLRAGNPHAAAQHAAGRYYWPSLDRLLDERRDAWIETALRAGADASRLGPRADVDHIRRKLTICG